MKKRKKMRRLKLYLLQGNLELFSQADGQGVACSANNTVEPGKETVPRDALAFKEFEESNSWARLGFQLHFCWFTLLLTVNAIAAVWLFRSTAHSFVPLVCFLFIVLDLGGAVATVLIGKYMLECDRRMQSLIEKLTRRDETEDLFSSPQSPMLRQAVKILFGFTAVTLIILLIFWIFLFGTI